MCSFCSAHIWPTATARKLPPPPPEMLTSVGPMAASTPDGLVLAARRLEKNFSLMASAEYLCSMKVGEICMGVVLLAGGGGLAGGVAGDLLAADSDGGLLESLLVAGLLFCEQE